MRLWKNVALAVLGIALGAASAHAQTILQYRFKDGEKLSYELNQKMEMSMNMMGKDVKINMDQSMDMAWQVLKLESNGNARVKLDITHVKMNMDGPMGKIEIDSKALKDLNDPQGQMLSKITAALAGLEMTFTMEPNGDIKDIKIPEKTRESLKNFPGAEQAGDLLSDESLKKMANSGVVFPKEALTKGKAWTHKLDAKMPMGHVKGDMEFTYEGPEEKDGIKLEKLALKPNVKLEPAANAPFQLKFKGQKGSGKVYFDNQAGRIVSVDVDQVIDVAIEANGMTITQTMDQKTQMKLKK